MTDPFRLGAVEVVRLGRFRWDVLSRYPGAIDMSLSQPYMFRWMAMRYAKRKVEEHSNSQEVVVARFGPGRPS